MCILYLYCHKSVLLAFFNIAQSGQYNYQCKGTSKLHGLMQSYRTQFYTNITWDVTSIRHHEPFQQTPPSKTGEKHLLLVVHWGENINHTVFFQNIYKLWTGGNYKSHTTCFPIKPFKTVKHSLNWMEHVNDFLTALKYGEEHSTTYMQPVQTAASSESHARD